MSVFPLRTVWLLTAAALITAGCGNGATLTGSSTRELQSLTISPTTATANGAAVQYTATGYWSQAPVTVTPQSATWGACVADGSATTTDVTLSDTGLATCGGGAKGTFMVFAWDPDYGSTGPVCNAVTACGPGCGRVAAQVQITCP